MTTSQDRTGDRFPLEDDYLRQRKKKGHAHVHIHGRSAASRGGRRPFASAGAGTSRSLCVVLSRLATDPSGRTRRRAVSAPSRTLLPDVEWLRRRPSFGWHRLPLDGEARALPRLGGDGALLRRRRGPFFCVGRPLGRRREPSSSSSASSSSTGVDGRVGVGGCSYGTCASDRAAPSIRRPRRPGQAPRVWEMPRATRTAWRVTRPSALADAETTREALTQWKPGSPWHEHVSGRGTCLYRNIVVYPTEPTPRITRVSASWPYGASGNPRESLRLLRSPPNPRRFGGDRVPRGRLDTVVRRPVMSIPLVMQGDRRIPPDGGGGRHLPKVATRTACQPTAVAPPGDHLPKVVSPAPPTCPEGGLLPPPPRPRTACPRGRSHRRWGRRPRPRLFVEKKRAVLGRSGTTVGSRPNGAPPPSPSPPPGWGRGPSRWPPRAHPRERGDATPAVRAAPDAPYPLSVVVSVAAPCGPDLVIPRRRR